MALKRLLYSWCVEIIVIVMSELHVQRQEAREKRKEAVEKREEAARRREEVGSDPETVLVFIMRMFWFFLRFVLFLS